MKRIFLISMLILYFTMIYAVQYQFTVNLNNGLPNDFDSITDAINSITVEIDIDVDILNITVYPDFDESTGNPLVTIFYDKVYLPGCETKLIGSVPNDFEARDYIIIDSFIEDDDYCNGGNAIRIAQGSQSDLTHTTVDGFTIRRSGNTVNTIISSGIVGLYNNINIISCKFGTRAEGKNFHKSIYYLTDPSKVGNREVYIMNNIFEEACDLGEYAMLLESDNMQQQTFNAMISNNEYINCGSGMHVRNCTIFHIEDNNLINNVDYSSYTDACLVAIKAESPHDELFFSYIVSCNIDNFEYGINSYSNDVCHLIYNNEVTNTSIGLTVQGSVNNRIGQNLIQTKLLSDPLDETIGVVFLSGNCSFFFNTIVNADNDINSIGIKYHGTLGPIHINSCILGNFNQEIDLGDEQSVVIKYSCLEDISNQYNVTYLVGNIDVNPLFVNPANNYTLQAISPCIDAGDPSSPIDPDGTINDMGCYYYHQEVDNRNFSGSEWNWISFPRLRVDENDEALSWKVLTILQPQLPSAIDIVDQHDLGQTYDGSTQEWQPENYTFDRISGYKINCPYASDLTLTVPGERVSEDTHVTLYPNVENWVGYFCESSSSPERALESIWDDFQLVKHHDWSYYRLTPGGTVYKLLTSGSVRPGFHYGDMAVIKTFNQATLIWNYDGILVLQHPQSQVFSYEEKADYTPIHVELETGTEAEEIGVFVDGECIGFGIVTNDETMIRAYLDGDTRSGNGDLEFVYYNGDRSQNHISDYCVYDEKLQVMISRKINSTERRDFYNVSLRKDGSSDSAPKPELTMNAYPNPFNPTTNISFYAPETENVKVEIFNIRGQKVKTLFDGVAHSGKNLLVWKGMNDSKQPVASGLYFCKISTNKETIKQKLMLLK